MGDFSRTLKKANTAAYHRIKRSSRMPRSTFGPEFPMTCRLWPRSQGCFRGLALPKPSPRDDRIDKTDREAAAFRCACRLLEDIW